MTSIHDYDPASDHLSYSVPYEQWYPLRRGELPITLTAWERDAIGTFCTAIGASWGNWCQSPSSGYQYYIGKFVIHRAGNAIRSLLLRWDQDNVWQLASQYYRAYRNGEYAMRLPVNEAEARRFQEQAHDAKLYAAVKKLMRLKWGPRWIQDPLAAPDWKAARLEFARHEVAAMAYGRMDVCFEDELHGMQIRRHEYYSRVRAASGGVGFVERFDLNDYDVRGNLARDASPPPQAPSSPPPVHASPPPVQASPPRQAPPSVQAPPPVQAQPPMPASAVEVQAPLAVPAPAAPPALLAPPTPPPWAHAMAAAFGQRLAPMEVDEGGGDDGLSCRVCFDKERQYVLQPCGHAAVCGPCLDRIRQGSHLRHDRGKCPICRVHISGCMRVYL